MTQKSKTALFAGSFNPFTTGHKSIVDRLLTICDFVIIGIGINREKPADSAEDNYSAIKSLYEGSNRVSVRKYEGLTADFAKECGADFMARGIRDVSDFEYERNLADINRRISGIETIFLPSLPELSYVSSSMVRELESYGHDVKEFIPKKNN